MKQHAFRAPDDFMDAIDAVRGDVSRNKWLTRAAEAKMLGDMTAEQVAQVRRGVKAIGRQPAQKATRPNSGQVARDAVIAADRAAAFRNRTK